MKRFCVPFILVILALLSASCSNLEIGPPPEHKVRTGEHDPNAPGILDSLGVGNGGKITLFGGDKKGDANGASVLGINKYLWVASRDVLSVLPIAASDPVGGLMTTEWGSPEGNPNEQIKATAFVNSPDLTASSVKVSVHRRVRNAAGEWEDALVNPTTITRLEDAILTRARQLRIEAEAKS